MTQKEREVLEKIAQVMENLPSESLLAKCWTEEQKEEWQKVRNTQLYIAECWRYNFIYNQVYPLPEALNKPEVSKHKYDLIVLSVELYKAQWELIQVAEKYVKRVHAQPTKLVPNKVKNQLYKFFPDSIFLKPYPFNSDYDLFVATLKEEIEGAFEICLEKHYSINFKRIKNGVKQLIDIIDNANKKGGIYPKLHPKEQQELKKNMGWHRISFSWWGMILFICQFAAIRDSSIRQKLTVVNKSLIKAFELSAKASYKLKSFTSIDGKKVPFDKFGGVPVKNDK
ncbi:hypothetical protein AFK68_25440 [Hydrocoleum sp. CS-953]|uniref:hypothetical protein n=1 Tax=Hydrocoleum sp. CS-953 TaxID=1671698 RepID=UPI000BDB3B04|nr:hypothetical protein [Hydrocoleum sp. CS-953]OZH52272.1 hypothetical protein AFK68_25440 [Hydrocoleum sp. CS-953]